MPDTSRLKFELLCCHHSLDNFASGDQARDASLRLYHRQVIELDNDAFLAIVAVEPTGDVVGAVVTVDFHLTTRDAAGETIRDKLCFFPVLWLVHQDYQRSALASKLVKKMYQIRQRKYATRQYDGDLTEPGDNPRLQQLLYKMGFRPDEDEPYLWFRPKDWTPDDDD
jgi:hypothetical protein